MNVIFLHDLFQPSSGLAGNNMEGIYSIATNHNFISINTGDVEEQLPFIFLHDRPQNGLYKTGQNVLVI